MATRSFIGLVQADSSIGGVYCYLAQPQEIGRVLIEHYVDVHKVNALFDLGDIAVILPMPKP